MPWTNPDEIKKMVDFMQSGGSVDLSGPVGGVDNDLIKAIDWEVNQRNNGKAPNQFPTLHGKNVTPSDPVTPEIQRMQDANEEMAGIGPVAGLAHGMAQGATAGFADEISGLGAGYAQDAKNLFSGNYLNPEQSGGQAYEQERDSVRARNDAASSQFPKEHTTGLIGGGALLPVPGGPAAKGLPALAKVGNAVARGMPVGMAFGAGSSEANPLQDPGQFSHDIQTGGAMGGLASGAMAAGGQVAQAGAQKALDSGAFDRILESWLRSGTLKSADVIKLKATGLFDDMLASVRQNTAFPYSAQAGAEALELPATAAGKSGTLMNPSLETPALEGPNTLDNAFTKSYMRPQTMPAPNQMPFPDRAASTALQGVANTSSAMDVAAGSQSIKPATGMWGAIKDRTLPVAGIGFHKVAEKMVQMIEQSNAAAGMSGVASGKLMQLIQAVRSAENPELEDYLAKEMSPEYNHWAAEAKSELEKEQGL